ncbi:MAG: hypothetical protein F6K11_22795 [Leptolyngbya sp. SIO3F4]|nr:hypothetical protein [Leptolyngbya sp. SIO3F4]
MRTKRILKGCLIAALCLGGVTILGSLAFVGYFGYQIEQSTKPVTDLERYPDIVNTPNDPLTAHFPKAIPANAKNVKLYYAPGFLQGGAILQLRMQLPSDEISKVTARFQPKAKRQYVPNGENNSPTEETGPDGISISYDYKFHTGDVSEKELPSNFPADYAIYVLDDTRGAPEYDWNHPEFYGVAINETTSEIVYWMEDW